MYLQKNRYLCALVNVEEIRGREVSHQLNLVALSNYNIFADEM